ncbi:Acyl-CoA dehydrogenase, C-terminal domain [Streptomyces melanosporofaciens]|uniref:Acyl-CoA dehydrogenase, C-terminal domain n=1 Tax=Streptomyces melanosporofaciens TaxID=67327 RepID=A0A1H4ZDX1_STRMJ|nr:Acyl-CoA dehydrogenase, C-terminal domain [Streptomyces melanosporofaciens]
MIRYQGTQSPLGDGRHRPREALQGHQPFVVEKSDEGASFGAPEKKLGIKGSPTREVYLDNVRIPTDRMIGEEGTGFATAMKTLDHTRITIAAQALGIAQGALDYAKGYAQERKQFGKPTADFQAIQFTLADMVTCAPGEASTRGSTKTTAKPRHRHQPFRPSTPRWAYAPRRNRGGGRRAGGYLPSSSRLRASNARRVTSSTGPREEIVTARPRVL